jgi:hypothetical protein
MKIYACRSNRRRITWAYQCTNNVNLKSQSWRSLPGEFAAEDRPDARTGARHEIGGGLLQERGDGHRGDAPVQVAHTPSDVRPVLTDQPQLVGIVGTIVADYLDLSALMTGSQRLPAQPS